ncbi:MAG TPA: LamG-like jellyroll fold domain-containing protein [Verrucomicrobiae bacterium]|nr:LamG-like jellyroll fold domain-containing protein [Verrucomicrobiae bacterium]
MRSRPTFWILLCLLLLGGAWFFWSRDIARKQNSVTQKIVAQKKTFAAPSFTTTKSGSTAPQFLAGKISTNAVVASAKTNQFPYRLSNTKKSIGELTGDRRAILLENALIDTGVKLNLAIPKNLQAQGDPGAYIVQARGPIDAAFRAQLAAAGAQIVSYIPNDAYLVRVSSGGANQLLGLPLTQSVIPYEPYYKISSSLLGMAVQQPSVLPGAPLTLGLFPDNSDATIAAIKNLGGQIIATGSSPFGPTVQVMPPQNWTALAVLPGVQIVEPFHQRIHANDLSRQTTGVSVDSVTTTNYMNLSGSNVLVAVDDTGIDATHPDLVNRVFGAVGNLTDTDGHGTFVAGQIAGDGTESTTVTNVPGSILTNGVGYPFQFRGKAPLATLLSLNFGDSDEALQAAAALTNALISNNSWNYGDSTYDLAAASYDAATRDALPRMTGSQPVLFIFSAGNDGNGDDTADPGGGNADTILSPGTGKNVITVGAIQQLRNITNQVTEADGTTNEPWAAMTSTPDRVAAFSSRGNVGIGTEGTTGRDKPDVVAPGTFVVSTRSAQWDIASYFFQNPTNHDVQEFDNIIAQPDSIFASSFPFVPLNAIQATIQVLPNADSPVPFPNLPIYVGQESAPGYSFFTTNNQVSIPPDGGLTIADIQSSEEFVGFNFGVSNITTEPISFDLITDVVTTNDVGNELLVLSNLDQSIGTPSTVPNSTGPGPYYRYESGTSMAAADVSGVLALMQDFFTNALHATPSPALLKAMLINGARPTRFYNFGSQNTINYEGWGLINLPNSLPLTITNLVNPSSGTNISIFFLDQSPTNALATGDSQTFLVAVNTNATILPLRVTLAWTDPPGNPAAAIKLVNNLDLVVTNLATGDVFFGNDIPSDSVFNSAWNTNEMPNLDVVNNIENVFLPPLPTGNYSVTVVGRDVNVNAITAQTNNSAGNFAPNVVQDYALVINYGNSADLGGITVTANPIVSNPTGDQQITFVTATNTPLFNQFAGGNTPLLGTNTVQIGGTNELVTLGMTNQWHFYVVTNNALDGSGSSVDVTNAAFITFLPDTLAIPRMGAFADSAADATQPAADIDMYVTTDPTLTNLNPVVISNCVNGTQIGASSAGPVFNGASLSRGGIELVVDTNSTPGQIYYIGVKSEDQEAAEYAFVPVFTAQPFSQMNANGDETVFGVPLPVNIPDGSPKHPGTGYVFALALQPVEVGNVVVTNTITHENFGDLIGVLTFNGISTVLNNHDSLDNPPGPYQLIYDDSGVTVGSQPSDGPGSLNSFAGQQGVGAWILTETDDSPTQTGSVTGFNMFLQKHQDPSKGIFISIQPGTWFYTFVDVAAGFTNLTVAATNTVPPTSTPPLQLYLNFGVQPDFSNFLESTELTNGIPQGNSLSFGPPLTPGRYFIGIFNPSLTTTANAFVVTTLSGTASANVPVDFSTNGPPLLDDAANSSTIFVPTVQPIASVNVGVVVNHPRISDLTFTLVSPTGQRVLLMENRGGSTTNGAGDVFIATNSFAPVTANGGPAAQTNFLNVGQTSGQLTINYDFFTAPDEMTVYYGTNSGNFTLPNALYDSGLTNGANTVTVNFGPGTSTFVTIIMNQFGNPALTNGGGTAWTYTVGGVQTNFNYLMFTEDTNLTTIPIKFAVPPYTLTETGTNYTLSDFELATNGDYRAPTNIFDAFGGWNVPTNLFVLTNINTGTNIIIGTNSVLLTNNEVSVVTDSTIAGGGSNFLALADGTIIRQIPMTVGRQFSLNFQYRGPDISAWYRGEGNATDSSDPETNGNNGSLIGQFNFPAGEVGQAFQMEDAGNEFQFAGTNSYVQIRQVPFLEQVPGATETNASVTVSSTALNVGTGSGFTIEGWISPTNVSFQQPLVEWLAGVPTNNAAVSNVVIEAGPFLDRATGHYYYMLGSTNWTTSEFWATQLGGHLATIDTANEQNWVFDTFAQYGGTNRNLWIGLNDFTNPGTLVWSGGLTNYTYTNWLSGQPNACTGNEHYTAILGSTNVESGLWVLADDNGIICGVPPTNQVYGVVEVNDIQTNGVQFWISVTNVPGTTNLVTGTNGCLFANLVDVTNGSHFIFSAPGLIQSNVFQHVALTYDTNSGIANLYYEGTNVASTNLGYFIPKTTGDVLLGKDMSRLTNNFYGGKMDEMSIYGRALSASEIASIYQISASTTNRNTGKFDPAITPGLSLAEAQVSLGGLTNVILGMNDSWQSQSFSFPATTNSLPMLITGLEPGMLLDSFSIAEAPLGNLYYQPEQTLDSLQNTSTFGTWTLEILDNRTGAIIANGNQLVSWQLQFVLASNTPPPIPLSPQDPSAISVPPGQIVYLTVAVPSWATFATNILVSSDLPVDLLFNPTNPPTGSNPGDFPLVSNSTGGASGVGIPVLSAASSPPLPANSYYLGVRNNGAHAASAVVEVDFNITALTNDIPLSSTLNTNDQERYFSFNVSSNASEATFQLLKLSSNADLVVRKGGPLPTLVSSDYGSFNVASSDENIYVLTNSSPVPLSSGIWYLGVFKRDAGAVNYTILAKELDTNQPVNIISLTNGVPFNFSAGPGAALTNFFSFTVTNAPASIQFELFNLTGNGDLTAQTNGLPLSPPFFQTSQQPGLDPELIFIQTNSALSSLTNSTLTNLNATWFLGVPNNEATNINYTILALINTNLVFPAFPGAEGAGAGASGGGRLGLSNTVYHVINLNDSGAGSLRDAVSSTNRTIVFDVSGTITLASPLIITNSFLTIAGQTAPGCGITVAGYMTTVQSAHDLIIRDVRFRRGAIDDSLMFTNVANVIADHVSAEWSDTVMSTLNSSNVTVQWSILADSLYITNNPPSQGSLLRYGSGVLSFQHNLYADNYSANPRLGDNLSLDFVNNVIYDWGTNAGFSTNDISDNPSGFTNELNYVCNYLIASSNSVMTNIAFWGGTTNTWIYQTNNFIDSDTNGILNGADTGWNMFTNLFTKFDRPFSLPPVSTDEAFLAYEKVLDFAGPDMTLRDSVDTNIVTSVRTQTGTFISTPPLSGMVGWWRAENNALDSAGTNNGTLVGGTGYSPGMVGTAFQFIGGNSGVALGDPTDLHFTNSFTIEGWVKVQILPGPAGYNLGQIIFRGDTRTYFDPYFLCVLNTGSFRFHLEDAAANGVDLDTAPFSINQWKHVAAVFNGTTGLMQIFVNGQLAAQTTTAIRPFQDLDPGYNPGIAIGNTENGIEPFVGLIDELTIFKRAISSNEVASIYRAGSAGKFPTAAFGLPPLDTDRDGIPDYWETTFGQNPTNASDFVASTNAIGYTDLEEYINWLAVPHALTITNTSVGIDLQQLFGKTGSLSFFVTNGVNGFVYLTNVLNFTNSMGVVTAMTNTGTYSNSIAVFTPTNNPLFAPTNYSGYASFDVYVTNTVTVANFGPVTVSVVVSAVPVIYAPINTNTPPVFTTNNLPNQTINELTTLTVTNTATDTNAGVTLSYAVSMVVDTAAMVASNWPTIYATTTPSPTIDTNGIITWTPTEAQGPGVYTITTVVSDNGIPPASATNSFTVTVNEVNLPPVFVGTPPNQTIPVSSTLIVTNAATDLDIPPNPLTYSFLSAPAGATVDTNGVITWTPTAPGVYTFTNVVTDTNAYALFNQSLSATNSFTVTVFFVTAPFVFSQPAQLVTGISAQLNGMVTPNGLPTTAWFQWGLTTNYANQTTPVSVGNIFNVVYTNSQISGLIPNVPYHFRLVASNAVGTNYGFDQILDEANVVTWGANFVGQLNVPAGSTNMTAIAAAYDHNLALRNNATAVGWGDNTFNQAAVPPGLSGLLAVAGGQSYSLVLKNTGTVVAWGANIFPNETNVPVGLSGVVTIASGQYSSLALKNNGTVVAWGANVSGLTNVPASLTNSAVAIAGGSFHSLAIKNDGTVVAWGDDSDGQTDVPAGLTNVVAISGGSFHSLALKYDGTVVAWGDDGANQIDVPAGLNNVVAIAAGGFHSMALKSDGSIVAWGDNSASQTTVPTGLTNFVAIAAGDLHSLALTPQSIASLTNIVLNLTNGVPETNNISPGGITYYKVNVPTNADFATNNLIFAGAPLNVWFTTNTPPTIATINDSLLLAGVTNGVSILNTTSAPPNIVPGATYYLGVQNTNSFSVGYAVEVDFHLLTTPPIVISSIVYTNISGTNGFLLTWFAPSNDLFQVQWNDNLGSTNWTTFTNPPVISYNTNFLATATNAQFNFFDDGSQTGGLPPMRFYRLILLTNPPPPAAVSISSITSTNSSGTPGFLLTWFAPTNDLFKVQWNTNLASTNWVTFTNIVAYDFLMTPSHSQFNFLDDGSQTGGTLGSMRFYRLILLQTTNSLTLPLQTNFTAIGSATVTVTNTAVDSRTGAILTYSLTNSPANASISTNGIITWTNATPSGLAARFNTVVTDDSLPPLTATNTFTIFVAPLPSITNVTVTATNVVLQWFAPTNDQFQVQWTTNLTPVINWTLFTNIITSPTGTFMFTDTNAPLLMKFYQLILLP